MSETNGHITRLAHWAAMSRPPATALKTIKGGRLQGMTDVSPQWRYQAMTAEFGPCGIGWKYTVDKLWTEKGHGDEVMAFAQVSVCVRTAESWSDPIPGVGGNHLISVEKSGPRGNDECWKMAITDALSVALKMLGVAADIYAGLWDGSKYLSAPTAKAPVLPPASKIALPVGTVQVVNVTVTQWGGEVEVVDDTGVLVTHPTTERQVAELAEQIQQEGVPVTLDLYTITKGKNAGKLKLVGVKRYVKPEDAQKAENNALDKAIAASEGVL